MIAFLHYANYNNISGVTTWLQALILHLHRQGIEVTVLNLDDQGAKKKPQFYNDLSMAGVDVTLTKVKSYSEDGVKTILKWLNKKQPTIFLPQCSYHGYLAAQVAGKAGLPWVYTIHSDDDFYWNTLSLLTPHQYGGHIVSVSKRIETLVREKNVPALQSSLIPYGMPIPNKTAELNQETFTIVYCGRLQEEQKRISLVLQTIILACERNTRIRGIIIGGGKDEASCRNAIRAAGLNDRIKVTGPLHIQDVSEHLLVSQCLLLMSDYEGLPLALLEAMSHGLVPITREIPSGIPQVVTDGQNGFLVSDAPEDAADKILKLANNPDRWHEMSNRCRKTILDAYSIDQCNDAWTGLISELALDKPLNLKEVLSHCVLPIQRLTNYGRSDDRKPTFPISVFKSIAFNRLKIRWRRRYNRVFGLLKKSTCLQQPRID